MSDKLQLEDILRIFYTKFIGERVGIAKEEYNERLNEAGVREYINELLQMPNINATTIAQYTDYLNGDEMLDLSDLATFYKNASCQKVYEKLSEESYRDLVTDEEVSPDDLDLEHGEIAIFERVIEGHNSTDFYRLNLVNNNKKISTDLAINYKKLPPEGEKSMWYAQPRKTFTGNTRIKEYTPYGILEAGFAGWQQNFKPYILAFKDDGFENIGLVGEDFTKLKREWLLNDTSSKLGCSESKVPRQIYGPKTDCKYDPQTEKSDILKIFTKLFNVGLTSFIYNPIYQYGSLEIEDTERATYDLSDAEQVLLSTTQRLDTIYEARKKEEAQETVQLEKEEKEETKEQEPLFQFQEEKLPLAIQALYNAKVNGIELSESQERTLQIYEKLNSEKFREFKAQAQERARKQEERRKAVREENARKEEWLNSADNPINMRLAELKKTRNQVTALEGIKDAGLIVPDQEQKLDNLSEFLEMFEKTSQEQHEVDTGMSDESRAWYQEHYRAK